jgi:hypothetical protein
VWDPKDAGERVLVCGRYISEDFGGLKLHPVDVLDAAAGSTAANPSAVVAQLVDPLLPTISPVNAVHPAWDVVASGSSRSIYVWRPATAPSQREAGPRAVALVAPSAAGGSDASDGDSNDDGVNRTGRAGPGSRGLAHRDSDSEGDREVGCEGDPKGDREDDRGGRAAARRSRRALAQRDITDAGADAEAGAARPAGPPPPAAAVCPATDVTVAKRKARRARSFAPSTTIRDTGSGGTAAVRKKAAAGSGSRGSRRARDSDNDDGVHGRGVDCADVGAPSTAEAFWAQRWSAWQWPGSPGREALATAKPGMYDAPVSERAAASPGRQPDVPGIDGRGAWSPIDSLAPATGVVPAGACFRVDVIEGREGAPPTAPDVAGTVAEQHALEGGAAEPDERVAVAQAAVRATPQAADFAADAEADAAASQLADQATAAVAGLPSVSNLRKRPRPRDARMP